MFMKWLPRLAPWQIVLLAGLACFPAIFTQYFGDDFIHYALLSPTLQVPQAQDWSIFGLFSWVDGNPERNHQLMNYSLIPWWTDDAMHYAFWRPLSELSHWLDHHLWHDSAKMMHLHNVLWYGVLGGLLFVLYRSLIPGVMAGIACFAFMLDATHGFTVAWIANRNAIIAACFCVLTLHCYQRAQNGELTAKDQPPKLMLGLSILSYTLALLSAEIGVSTAAYLGAYALTLDKRGPRASVLALWPFVLITLAWWGLYKLGHFGANASDTYYIDPVESPLLFLSKLVERIPVLLFSQWGFIPAEIYGFSPGPIWSYVAIATLFVAWVGYLMWPLLKSSPQARFWALGMLGALGPICAALPHDRNLLLVGIGASALVGMLFAQVYEQGVSQSGLRRGIKFVLFLQLCVAPLLLPMTSYSPKWLASMMGMQHAAQLPVNADAPDNILLVGLPLPTSLGMVPMRYAEKRPLPKKLWMLSSEPLQFHLKRTDDNTLIVDAPLGMVNGIEGVLRNVDKKPFRIGEQVPLAGMTIEVSGVNSGGHPTQLTLHFSDGELAHTRFLQWKGNDFQAVSIPAAGNEVQLSWADN